MPKYLVHTNKAWKQTVIVTQKRRTLRISRKTGGRAFMSKRGVAPYKPDELCTKIKCPCPTTRKTKLCVLVSKLPY
jgi:hypothetical protein